MGRQILVVIALVAVSASVTGLFVAQPTPPPAFSATSLVLQCGG